MKTPLKAALLSAFFCLGAGHFFLKKYISGTLLLCTSLIIIGFLLKEFMVMMEPLINQIEAGDLPLAISSMKDLLSNYSLFGTEEKSDTISYVIVLVWLISIIDSYRLGLLADIAKNN